MNFKRKCPNCSAKDKQVNRCSLCFDLICSSCSIDKICIDCYTDSKKMIELNNYFADKYKDGIVI